MSSSSTFLKLTLTLTLTITLTLSVLIHALPRPDPSGDAAVFARWLVAESSWGVLATLESHGYPFNNVMSFSDGGTGVPHFYLSELDPTGRHAANGTQLASFTISEASLGYCVAEDPQSPACARITLSGKLRLLRDAEAEFGEAVLFAKHPQFRGFSKMMGFRAYAMDIGYIYLLNEKAPSKKLAVNDYLTVN